MLPIIHLDNVITICLWTWGPVTLLCIRSRSCLDTELTFCPDNADLHYSKHTPGQQDHHVPMDLETNTSSMCCAKQGPAQRSHHVLLDWRPTYLCATPKGHLDGGLLMCPWTWRPTTQLCARPSRHMDKGLTMCPWT